MILNTMYYMLELSGVVVIEGVNEPLSLIVVRSGCVLGGECCGLLMEVP